MNENGRRTYKVRTSANVAQQIKQLAGIAGLMGKRAAFLSSLQTIYQRLRDNPSEFGEYRFGSKELKLDCFVGAIQPVAVQFAIQ